MIGRSPTPAPPEDLVEIASASDFLHTLTLALHAAGLAEELKSRGPFTLFAPTDRAFGSIPGEELDALAADRVRLADLVARHIVAGALEAAEVARLTSVRTLSGQAVEIRAGDDGVYVAGAKVIGPDLTASNGVIHLIDAVLL